VPFRRSSEGRVGLFFDFVVLIGAFRGDVDHGLLPLPGMYMAIGLVEEIGDVDADADLPSKSK